MRSRMSGALRHALAAALGAIVGGALLVGCADSVDNGGDRGTPERSPSESVRSSPSPSSREHPEVFIPSTYMEGGMVVLPLTFPDGSVAELAYPPSLDIAGMGARPYWAGCGRDFGFSHYDPYGTVYDGEPLETYEGANGEPVSLWRGAKGTGGADYLIFHFGPWTVDVYQYRTGSDPEAIRECAEGLTGTVTEDGWVVLDGPASVSLPDGSHGPPEGAEIQFGGLSPRSFVLLWPGPCENEPYQGTTEVDGVHVDLHRDFASWCDAAAKMRIHLYFKPDSDLFRRVFNNVEVRNVVTAGS